MASSENPASSLQWVPPRERELRVREARRPKSEPSLLEELFRWLEDEGTWRINFADLAGLAQVIPDLQLPLDYQLHACAFCVHAKSSSQTHWDCARNKQAVNRLLIRRRAGFVGQCHLGITDLVEPLLAHGVVIGVFYYGSVLEEARLQQGEERVRRYCARRGLDTNAFLTHFLAVPKVSEDQLNLKRQRLRVVANIAGRLVEAWGFPTGAERQSLSGAVWVRDERLPILLRRGMEHVQRHFREDLNLGQGAESLGISSDYLGGLFREHLRCTFGEYLLRVRVNHARRLLATRRHSVGEVAQLTGFKDQAHFGKVFKRLVGLSPSKYTSRSEV